MKTLGIVGLGAMGFPIAQRLQKQGYRLLTTVRSERGHRRAQALNIEVVSAPDQLPQHTDTVLLLVSNAEQCRDCLLGERGIFASMTAGVIILSSTVSPEQAAIIQADCPAGIDLLDAPVSGGVSGAEQGQLVTIAAGNAGIIDRCRDIFSAYSKKIIVVGENPGQAQAVKAINQMLVSIHMAGTAEALALANASGLDPRLLFEVISESAGNSAIFQSRAPKLIDRDFSVRASLETLKKDTEICIHLAETNHVPCYLTAL